MVRSATRVATVAGGVLRRAVRPAHGAVASATAAATLAGATAARVAVSQSGW